MAGELGLWMNGERVGSWRIARRGAMELLYDPAWMASPNGRPLSLSLPYRFDRAALRGDAVRCYFDNLLPDSETIRQRLASRFRTASAGPFDLLAAIGRDCVGALQLLPEGEAPGRVRAIEGTPLDEAQIEQVLLQAAGSAAAGPGADDDDFRISLAGAQEKTALLLHQGRWLRPHGATPTTHIFKLPMGLVGNRRADFQTSVENEWLCSRILAAYGLPVATCGMGRFGAQKALVVERFDRQLHPGGAWWMRLPQEDFCQALAVPPHAKYEADGGPGIETLAAVLRQSVEARADLELLMSAQILFWMLAAVDGHAKNFSLRLLSEGRYRLTPLYDVMSAWPVVGKGPNQFSWHRLKLAMAVSGNNRHYLLKDIQRRHFNATAPRCLWAPTAEPLIERLLAATPCVIEQVKSEIPAGFPGLVAERVLGGLAESAHRLEAMPAH